MNALQQNSQWPRALVLFQRLLQDQAHNDISEHACHVFASMPLQDAGSHTLLVTCNRFLTETCQLRPALVRGWQLPASDAMPPAMPQASLAAITAHSCSPEDKILSLTFLGTWSQCYCSVGSQWTCSRDDIAPACQDARWQLALQLLKRMLGK